MASLACSRRVLTALLRDSTLPHHVSPTSETTRTYATHKSQKPKKSPKQFPDDFYIPFDPTPLSKITPEQAGPSAIAPTPAPFHASLPQSRNDSAEEPTPWVTRGSQDRPDEEPQMSLVLDGELKGMSGDGIQRVIERDFFFDSSRLRASGLFAGLQPKASSVMSRAEEKKTGDTAKQPAFGSKKATVKAKTKPSVLNREERLRKYRKAAGIPESPVEPEIEVETPPTLPEAVRKAPRATTATPRSAVPSEPRARTPKPFSVTPPGLSGLAEQPIPNTTTKNSGSQPSTAWLPTRRLSPDALDGVRALHTQYPETFTIPILADHFSVGTEAIRRILKSKWKANAEEQEDRRERWDRRGARLWTTFAEKGEHPPKRWREMGIGGGPRYGEARREWVEKKRLHEREAAKAWEGNEGFEGKGYERAGSRMVVRKDIVAGRPA